LLPYHKNQQILKGNEPYPDGLPGDSYKRSQTENRGGWKCNPNRCKETIHVEETMREKPNCPSVCPDF